MLEFDHLTKQYSGGPHPAVSDISFQVRPGEVMGFIGMNGAGKSTAIRVAAGILFPNRGTVRIDGFDIVREKVRASAQLGLVPESPQYEPQARALPLLRYFAAYHGIDSAAAERRGRELLGVAGLAGTENLPLRVFSLGMRKRFAIAASLISDPQNLLLDEVLNGLDPAGLAFTRSWMGELRRQGRSVLLSSHNLAELYAIADRVALIHAGQLLKVATREEVSHLAQQSVVLTFDPVDDAALILLGHFGRTELLRPRVVAVRGVQVDPAEIVAALVAARYRIAEVRPEGSALEAYFVQTVKGAA